MAINAGEAAAGRILLQRSVEAFQLCEDGNGEVEKMERVTFICSAVT
jgi:hypothetical protein